MKSTAATEQYLDIVAEHSALIYKVCYMYADDAEHLKDLYQEVLANLWQGIDGFRHQSKVSTWIYRVAINTCVTFYRRHSKHSSVERLDDAAYAVVDDDSERAMMLKQMYEMIGRLGTVDKAIIMLWLDEHSYEEIADVTGLTRNNVASRLHRIRERLIKQNRD